MQFALRPAEAGDGENRRYRGPGRLFATRRHEPTEQFIEFEQPPKTQRQPDIVELAIGGTRCFFTHSA
jgi:hypothetical protein